MNSSNTLQLLPGEAKYIQACEKLLKDGRLRFELKHLHTDIENSSDKVRQFSDVCFAILKTMKPKYELDKTKAIDLLQENDDHMPSRHLRAYLLESMGQNYEAQELYMLNVEYAPSLLRYATLLFEKRADIGSMTQFEAKEMAVSLTKRLMETGYVHAINLLGCMMNDNYGEYGYLSKREAKTLACEQFKKAAEKQCACAIFNLANSAFHEEGIFAHMGFLERKIFIQKNLDKALEFDNPRAIQFALDLATNRDSFFSTWKESDILEKIYTVFQQAKDCDLNYKLHESVANKVMALHKPKICYQQILDSLFSVGLFVDKNNEKYIQDENFLIYAKNGFKVDYLGSIMQGKCNQVEDLRNEFFILNFVNVGSYEFNDLPSEYLGVRLKKAELELDASKINKTQNTKLKYNIIIKA